MESTNKYREISDEMLESLLLDMRPEVPDEPLHPRVDDLTRRRVVSEVLAEYEDAVSVRTRAGGGRRWMWAAAAVVGVTAASLFWMTQRTGETSAADSPARVSVSQPAPGDGSVEVVPHSRFSLLHGEVNCGDKAVELGATVPMKKWIETRNGQSAFSLPTGIAVGLSDNSAARVFWNGSRRYEVEVNQGMALFSVDPHRAREGFFVRTPKGTIRVIGTLFTVIVEDEGSVSVHLHRGEVDVVSKDHASHRVREGHTAVLRDHNVGVAKSTENVQVTRQLYRMGCIDAGQIFSELTNVDCDAGFASRSNGLSESSGARGESGAAPRGTASEKVSLEALLQKGRDARRYRQWAEAADAYRMLIRAYPGHPDARTALVTLAQIELQRLNNSRSALRHFNAYLASPGALVQEAMYGKAKACRQLGDADGEWNTLKQLVAQYPSGPISTAAGKRMAEISKK